MSTKNIVKVPATILRELRESLNIPVEVAAKKLKIDKSLLETWEKEGISVSVSKARIIAKIYNRNWFALLLKGLPKKDDLPKSYRSILSGNVNFSTETILGFRNAERILALADSIDGRKPKIKEIEKFNFNINSDPEELAKEVREWLGIKTEEVLKIKESYDALRYFSKKVESKGFYVSEFKMSIEEPEKIRAFCMSDKNRSVIILNKKDSHKGRIFSLFHELAHLLLDSNYSFDVFINNEDSKLEKFCNHFAGSLLLPKEDINKLFTEQNPTAENIYLIQNKYHVSEQTIIRRLFEFDVITEDLFQKRNAELNHLYEKWAAKKKNDKFIPSAKLMLHQRNGIKKNSFALSSEIISAYKEDRISIYDAFKMLDLKIKFLPKVESILTKNGY